MTFTIEHHVAAPIEEVWASWTTAEMLEKWYSPGPINWHVKALDVRPGGRFEMTMATPDGEHVATGSYDEVTPPTRLVQNPDGQDMQMITELEPEAGGTRMTVSMPGLPENQHDMMKGAWSGGFAKLDELLAAAK